MADYIRQAILRSYHHLLTYYSEVVSDKGSGEKTVRSEALPQISALLRQTVQAVLTDIDQHAALLEESLNDQTATQTNNPAISTTVLDLLVIQYESIEKLIVFWQLCEIVYFSASHPRQRLLGYEIIQWLEGSHRATFQLRLQQCQEAGMRPELCNREADPAGLDYWADLYTMALYGELDLVAEMLSQHSQSRQGSRLAQEFSSLIQILRSHPFVLYRDPTLTWDGSTLATDLAVWKDRFRDLSMELSRSILLAVPQLDGLFRLLAGERLALDRMTAHDLHAKICSHLLYASANASALLVSRGNIVTLLKQCLGEGEGTAGNEGSYMVSALLEMLSTGGAITSVWQQLLQLRQDVKNTCGLALDGLLTQALAHLALLLRFEVPELQIVLPGRAVNAVDEALQGCVQALLEMDIALELPLGYLSFMSEGVATSQTISSLAQHFLSTSHYLGDEEVMEVLSFLKNTGAEEEYRSLAQQRAEMWLIRGPLAPLLPLSSSNNNTSSSTPPPPRSVISKALQYLICAGNTSMVVQVTDALLFLVMLSVRRFLQGDLQFYPGPPLPMAVSRAEQANRLTNCMRLLRIEETTMDGRQELEEVLLQSVEALQLLRDDDLLAAALPEEEDMALPDMIEALHVYVDAVRSLFQHVQDGPAAQAKAFREAAHQLLGLMRPNSTPRFNVRYHLHIMEMVTYLHRRHAETVVKEQSPSAIFLKNDGKKTVLPMTASNNTLRLSVASADEVRNLMIAIGEIETFSGFGDLLVLCGWRESSEGDEDGLAALKRQFLGMLTVATLEEAHLRYQPEVIQLDEGDAETPKDFKGMNWIEEAKGFESSYLY